MKDTGGWTKVPNAFYELKLEPYEFIFVMMLARLTLGWRKKSDIIALNQFNMSVSKAQKVRKSLRKKGIIWYLKRGHRRVEYGFAAKYVKLYDGPTNHQKTAHDGPTNHHMMVPQTTPKESKRQNIKKTNKKSNDFSGGFDFDFPSSITFVKPLGGAP